MCIYHLALRDGRQIPPSSRLACSFQGIVKLCYWLWIITKSRFHHAELMPWCNHIILLSKLMIHYRLHAIHIVMHISMVYCKTAVTPLLTQWSYCSLAINHRYHTFKHDGWCSTPSYELLPSSPSHCIRVDFHFHENWWELLVVERKRKSIDHLSSSVSYLVAGNERRRDKCNG